ncbi:MAG: Eco57I restriction-modification methylase domain-containing protein [Promethearchaeota archaeon]
MLYFVKIVKQDNNKLLFHSVEMHFHKYLEKNRYDKKKNSNLVLLQKLWYEFMKEILKNSQKYAKLLSNIPNQQDRLGNLYQFFYENEIIIEKGGFKICTRNPKDRDRGKVYTPLKIISFIIDLIQYNINEDIRKRKKINSTNVEAKLKIADIACGTGRFLNQWWLKELKNNSKSNYNKIIQYFGYDNDSNAIKIARQSPLKKVKWKNIDSLLNSNLDLPNQFDIILGNPPYIESRAIPDDSWIKLKEKYESGYKKFDLSVLFLEKIVFLLKIGGWAGIIITNKWLVSDYGEKIREILLTQTHIKYIFDVSHLELFKGSSIYPIIIIFQKMDQNDPKIPDLRIKFYKMISINQIDSFFTERQINSPNEIFQTFFLKSPKKIISTSLNSENIDILQHFWELIEKNEAFRLGNYGSPYELRKGIHTGNIKSKLITNNPPQNDFSYKHAITSRYRVERFHISWQGLWIHYKKELIKKESGEYGSLREKWIFEAVPKIFIKLFGTRIHAAIDFLKYYANNSLIILVRKQQQKFNAQKDNPILYNPDEWFSTPEEEFFYILGILNSEIISKYYRIYFNHTHVRGNYLQFYIKDLNNIPFMIPNQTNISNLKEIATVSQKLTECYSNIKINSNKIDKLELKLNRIVKKIYGII